jgi:hypothetical protein
VLQHARTSGTAACSGIMPPWWRCRPALLHILMVSSPRARSAMA